MSIWEQIAEKARALPIEKQAEILQLLDSAYGTSRPEPSPRRGLLGLCEDLHLSVSAEEIDAARREMWGNFPRADIA